LLIGAPLHFQASRKVIKHLGQTYLLAVPHRRIDQTFGDRESRCCGLSCRLALFRKGEAPFAAVMLGPASRQETVRPRA